MSKTKSTEVYVRDATGLVRALGAKDMFVWTIVFFPWFSSWISNFWYTPGVVWNVNYYLSLGIWFVLFCIIPPAVWWMMTCIMPKTGGDYVFASRGLHPALGFAASFSVTFALALTAIAGGPLYGLAEAAGQLETAGQIAGNPAVTAAGFFIDPFGGGSKVAIYTIGIIILVVGAAFAFFGTGIYNKVMWTVFIIGIVGLVIELPIMLTTSKAAFTAAYAQYFPGGVPGVFAAAQKAGYVPGWTVAASIAAVPLLLINLGPYLFMYNVAGEVKEAKRSYLVGVWGAIFLSAAIFFLLTFLTDQVMGLSFVEAWTLGPGGGYPPVISALLAVVAPNVSLNIVLAIILLVSNIGFGYLGFAFASRPMLAWAFDRVLPSKLSSVNERYHSPAVAIFVTFLIALLGWSLLIWTKYTSVLFQSLIVKFVAWAIVSLAAVVIPFRKKALFERSTVKWRIGGIPVLSIVGLLSFLIFAGYVVNSITTKVFYTPSFSQTVFMGSIFVIAIVGYFVSYAYRKSQGIDISKAFVELPPD